MDQKPEVFVLSREIRLYRLNRASQSFCCRIRLVVFSLPTNAYRVEPKLEGEIVPLEIVKFFLFSEIVCLILFL